MDEVSDYGAIVNVDAVGCVARYSIVGSKPGQSGQGVCRSKGFYDRLKMSGGKPILLTSQVSSDQNVCERVGKGLLNGVRLLIENQGLSVRVSVA